MRPAPSSWVEKLAAAVLEHVGLDSSPPIDVESLASLMGVRAIRVAPQVEDGRLEHGPDGCWITLRTDLNPARRRFTIAHEVAHLILLNPNSAGVARRMRACRSSEERLCDEIAAAVLLPTDWICQRYEGCPRTLRTTRQLADETGTSLSAATLRLRELLAWPETLLRWRYASGKWRFAAAVGVPPGLFGRIRSAAETSASLATLEAGDTMGDLRATVPLVGPHGRSGIETELSFRGSSAVGLADLSDWIAAPEPAASAQR